MKLGFGKDRLTPEQRRIVDRLEQGVLSAEEAGRLLIESASATEAWLPGEPEASAEAWSDEVESTETPEEAAARELVERIARESYADPRA